MGNTGAHQATSSAGTMNTPSRQRIPPTWSSSARHPRALAAKPPSSTHSPSTTASRGKSPASSRAAGPKVSCIRSRIRWSKSVASSAVTGSSRPRPLGPRMGPNCPRQRRASVSMSRSGSWNWRSEEAGMKGSTRTTRVCQRGSDEGLIGHGMRTGTWKSCIALLVNLSFELSGSKTRDHGANVGQESVSTRRRRRDLFSTYGLFFFL